MNKLAKNIVVTILSSTLFFLQAGTLKNTNGIESKDNFLINSAKSYSERAGQIFAIPEKYNIVMGDYSLDGFSHFIKDGKPVKVKNLGTGHGTPWDYDTHIPIIMYGPSFINSGKKTSNFATQQDLVNTYASILNTEPPVDSEGRVLTEALKKTKKKPKVIMTFVLDQVGMAYYNAHPNSFPEIKRIMKNGTVFTNAKVTHLESETAVGHTAIGTGAYPDNHGITGNSFWLKGLGKESYAYGIDKEESPVWLKSPSLSDVYDYKMKNKPIIISYCWAERAAMGMAGHGAMYKGGDKDMVFYYDDKKDEFKTNDKYFSFPNYIKDMKVKPSLDKLTNGTGIWMEHKIPYLEKTKKVITKREVMDNKAMLTPIFPIYEAEMFEKVIENEPIGQDDITDLIYFTSKSTDLASHAFGFESEEAREVLEATDNQLARILRALEKKVGKDNYILTITADHGSTPLPERTGGLRVFNDDLKDILNKKFDKLQNGLDVFLDVGGVEIVLDEKELNRNGYKLTDVKKFLSEYKVGKKKLYQYVFTKEEILKLKYQKELN